jgi:ABC-2 type transport system permease protein
MLPEIWQTIALGNPILYMINAFRYGLIGISDIDIETALIMIIGFIVLLTVTALFLLHKGTGIKN